MNTFYANTDLQQLSTRRILEQRVADSEKTLYYKEAQSKCRTPHPRCHLPQATLWRSILPTPLAYKGTLRDISPLRARIIWFLRSRRWPEQSNTIHSNTSGCTLIMMGDMMPR